MLKDERLFTWEKFWENWLFLIAFASPNSLFEVWHTVHNRKYRIWLFLEYFLPFCKLQIAQFVQRQFRTRCPIWPIAFLPSLFVNPASWVTNFRFGRRPQSFEEIMAAIISILFYIFLSSYFHRHFFFLKRVFEVGLSFVLEVTKQIIYRCRDFSKVP